MARTHFTGLIRKRVMPLVFSREPLDRIASDGTPQPSQSSPALSSSSDVDNGVVRWLQDVTPGLVKSWSVPVPVTVAPGGAEPDDDTPALSRGKRTAGKVLIRRGSIGLGIVRLEYWKGTQAWASVTHAGGAPARKRMGGVASQRAFPTR